MGASNPGYQIFTDRNQWQRYWSIEYNRPIREVDFEKHFVVYITLGQKKTGGYRLNILHAIQQSDQAQVNIITAVLAIEEPRPGQGVDLGETNPYILVQVKAPIRRNKISRTGQWELQFVKQQNGRHMPLDMIAIPQTILKD